MLVYEVSLRIRPEAFDAVAAWLPGHAEEVVTAGGALGAEVFDDTADEGAFGGLPDPDGARRLVVHYRFPDADALAAYLRDHAPRLRADGLRRFGDGFTATRRILRPLA